LRDSTWTFKSNQISANDVVDVKSNDKAGKFEFVKPALPINVAEKIADGEKKDAQDGMEDAEDYDAEEVFLAAEESVKETVDDFQNEQLYFVGVGQAVLVIHDDESCSLEA
jgi:hypothetical protein